MSEHDAPEVVTHAKSALSKKIGPLPAGVWALAIIGGVVVAVVIRRNANDQATQDAADTIATADTTDTSGWDQPDPGGTHPGAGGSAPGTGAGGDGSYPEGGGTPTPAPEPEPDNGGPNGPKHGAMWKARHATTNPGWVRWSVEAMNEIGFNRAGVENVLHDYLAGEKLNTAQTGVLGATLARCGPPPTPPKRKADPGTHHPKPPKTPGTKDHGHGNEHPHPAPAPAPHHPPTPHHPAPHPIVKQPGPHHPPVKVPHPTKPPKGNHHG